MNLSLKTQNQPFIIAYATVMAALFWWTTKGNFDTTKLLGLDKYYGSTLFVAVATIATLAIGELVPRSIKLSVVYWRLKNPAPGCRAFTEIAPKDHRISIPSIVAKYGELPIDATMQDRLFYQIYHPLRDDIGVADAHKSFLLFRELTVLSIVSFILGFPASWIFSQDLIATIVFSSISGIGYAICALAAQNAGKRLVANTLAVASIGQR